MVTAKAENGFEFRVHAKLGEISHSGKYSKELRIVEWGKYPPKFDLRPWDTESPDGTRSQKGITLTLDEMIKLKEILEGIKLEEYVMPDKMITMGIQ